MIIYCKLFENTINGANEYCEKYLPDKIPDIRNSDYQKKAGDCI